MMISSKVIYGLGAMLDMAINSLEEYTPLNILAERQNISVNYLWNVMDLLKKADLVKSVKGYHGGYALSTKSSNIYVGDILRVLEGNLVIKVDNYKNNNNDMERCINEIVWENINTRINEIIDSVTLEQLALEYKKFSNNQHTINC